MQPSRKLRLDFGKQRRLFGAMEIRKARLDLIQHLLPEAGRIMKDGSPELALTFPYSPEDVARRVKHVATNASALTALAGAAESLLRQRPEHR